MKYNHGEYEHSIDVYCPDELTKRLITAAQMGVIITSADGHRWINSFEVEDYPSLNDDLMAAGLPEMRSKCYGNLLDALARVDGALKALNRPSLLESYCSSLWF